MPSPAGVSLRFGALGELAPCFPLGWIVHSVRGGTVELLPDSGRQRDEGGGHSGIPMRFSFVFGRVCRSLAISHCMSCQGQPLWFRFLGLAVGPF